MPCTMAFADGGQVRRIQRSGDWQITVFTSPIPLRAGMVDVSVLVQDAATGQVVTDADVMIRLAPVDDPTVPLWEPATRSAATNKLYHAARFELPSAGQWDVQVLVSVDRRQAPISVEFAMDAGKRMPTWFVLWPWLSWPFLVIVLFIVHRARVERRHRRHAKLHREGFCHPSLPILQNPDCPGASIP